MKKLLFLVSSLLLVTIYSCDVIDDPDGDDNGNPNVDACQLKELNYGALDDAFVNKFYYNGDGTLERIELDEYDDIEGTMHFNYNSDNDLTGITVYDEELDETYIIDVTHDGNTMIGTTEVTEEFEGTEITVQLIQEARFDASGVKKIETKVAASGFEFTLFYYDFEWSGGNLTRADYYEVDDFGFGLKALEGHTFVETLMKIKRGEVNLEHARKSEAQEEKLFYYSFTYDDQNSPFKASISEPLTFFFVPELIFSNPSANNILTMRGVETEDNEEVNYTITYEYNADGFPLVGIVSIEGDIDDDFDDDDVDGFVASFEYDNCND